MKVAGVEFDQLMQILGISPLVNRAGFSLARMHGLPSHLQPEIVSRLAGMGLPAGMTRAAVLPALRDPTAAAVPPFPPRRRQSCPACGFIPNEEP